MSALDELSLTWTSTSSGELLPGEGGGEPVIESTLTQPPSTPKLHQHINLRMRHILVNLTKNIYIYMYIYIYICICVFVSFSRKKHVLLLGGFLLVSFHKKVCLLFLGSPQNGGRCPLSFP